MALNIFKRAVLPLFDSWLSLSRYMGTTRTNIVEMGDSRNVNQTPTESKQRKFTVIVEGNIGCGKSTLLDFFQNSPTVEALAEPVDRWTNINGHNGLKLLYDDPARWSFAFNNYAMLTRLQLHQHQSTLPVKMLERSLHSTQHIFVQNALKNGCLTVFEHAVLSDWYNYLTSLEKTKVDLIVYLKTPPEICYERLKHRNRTEEKTVPFDLIHDLHELYENWLVKKTLTEVPAPVMVLDATPDIPSMFKVYESRREEILCGCV